MNRKVWTAPTRRAFVTMLGLGAAALAVVKVKVKRSEAEKPTAPEVPGTLWIGHC
jgi:hypothetical protein